VIIEGDGAAPCVTIEFLEVETETQLGGNSKVTSPLYEGSRYYTL
jgi:hypothetical protein